MSRTFDEILADCLKLKNQKQLKYKRGEDPLSAFLYTSSAAKIPLVNHIFARIVDKEGRLSNFLSDNPLHIDAMIEEAEDSINYLVFLIMALERLVQPIEAQQSQLETSSSSTLEY